MARHTVVESWRLGENFEGGAFQEYRVVRSTVFFFFQKKKRGMFLAPVPERFPSRKQRKTCFGVRTLVDETGLGGFVALGEACRTLSWHKLAYYVRYIWRFNLNLIRNELLLRCSAAQVDWDS